MRSLAPAPARRRPSPAVAWRLALAVPVLCAAVASSASAAEWRPQQSTTGSVTYGLGLGAERTAFDAAGRQYLSFQTSFPDYEAVVVIDRQAPPATGWRHVGTWKPMSASFGPAGVAVTPDGGTVYITQNDSDRTIRKQVGAQGRPTTIGTGASDIALGPDGALYASPISTGRIQRFAADGERTLVGPSIGRTYSLAVGPDGSIYVGVANGIRRLAPGGTAWESLPTGGTVTVPVGVAVAPDGAIVWAERGASAQRIYRLPRGASGPTLVPFTGLTDLSSVEVGPDGTIYAANRSAVYERSPAFEATVTAAWPASPVTAGPIAFDVHVASAGDGVPTGHVALVVDGEQAPASATLDGDGRATIATVLAAGTHEVQLLYLGDDEHRIARGPVETLEVVAPVGPEPLGASGGGGGGSPAAPGAPAEDPPTPVAADPTGSSPTVRPGAPILRLSALRIARRTLRAGVVPRSLVVRGTASAPGHVRVRLLRLVGRREHRTGRVRTIRVRRPGGVVVRVRDLRRRLAPGRYRVRVEVDGRSSRAVSFRVR